MSRGWISAGQFHRDHLGQRYICAACGHPQIPAKPLIVNDAGYRVHAECFRPEEFTHGR